MAGDNGKKGQLDPSNSNSLAVALSGSPNKVIDLTAVSQKAVQTLRKGTIGSSKST